MNTSSTLSDSDHLCCLVYASKATRPFSDQELQALLQKSRFNNARDNISGMLTYVKGMFFQMLEGPEDKVNLTYQRIMSDPRHTAITKIKGSRITTRHFPQWTMGFPTPNAEMLSRFTGYSDLSKKDSQDLQRLKSHHSGLFQIICDYGRKTSAAGAN